MKLLTKEYITPLGIKNAKSFKYKGRDDSILNNYFYIPISKFLVDYIFPPWLAPNTVTMIGFMVAMLSNVLIFTLAKVNGVDDEDFQFPAWLLFF